MPKSLPAVWGASIGLKSASMTASFSEKLVEEVRVAKPRSYSSVIFNMDISISELSLAKPVLEFSPRAGLIVEPSSISVS